MTAIRAPLALHQENPRYFEFRGAPLVLITATEHYGAVLNRNFDAPVYLDEAADKRATLSRCFLLFRELEHVPLNPHSPCKPVPGEYVAPFARSGSDFALDGFPKFDLDQWDDEYFERLHHFLGAAAERGIVVELTLFSNTYSDAVWRLNPLNCNNNTAGAGAGAWQDYTSMRDAALWERQQAYVRKIVGEVNQYDNLYFEVCNEPFGDFPGHASVAEVEAWQAAIRDLIRTQEAALGRHHLIFQVPVERLRRDNRLDKLADAATVDAINIHDYQQLTFRDVPLPPLARFMQRDLRLDRIRHLWTACYDAAKPLVFDEDNAATNGLDEQAWMIHRKRAWTTVCSGGHYNMIDFSIQAGGQETGTPASRAMIRSWLKHLSVFIHQVDFVHMAPLPDFCSRLPDSTLAATLAAPGIEYVIYLADRREIDEAGCGEPLAGSMTFTVPPGGYCARLYDPVLGRYRSEPIDLKGGAIELELPSFRHDLVVHITARG